MIVSASRRTDLPAFYSEWLKHRLEAGYAVVKNPFNPAQTRRVDLRPAPEGGMDVLILWTRNPAPLLPVLPEWERRGLRTLWLVTVTGYPRALEPDVPPTEEALKSLEALSALVGPKRIAWRYDPVFACPALGLDEAFHRGNFAKLARRLSKRVHHGVVSLYDDYAKARRRLAAAGIAPDPEAALRAASSFAPIANREGFDIQSCCEDIAAVGIAPGGCIDARWIDALWDLGLGDAVDAGQRPGCRCAPSADIGVYDTCRHGCLYCYATTKTPRRPADPASESLL